MRRTRYCAHRKWPRTLLPWTEDRQMEVIERWSRLLREPHLPLAGLARRPTCPGPDGEGGDIGDERIRGWGYVCVTHRHAFPHLLPDAGRAPLWVASCRAGLAYGCHALEARLSFRGLMGGRDWMTWIRRQYA